MCHCIIVRMMEFGFLFLRKFGITGVSAISGSAIALSHSIMFLVIRNTQSPSLDWATHDAASKNHMRAQLTRLPRNIGFLKELPSATAHSPNQDPMITEGAMPWRALDFDTSTTHIKYLGHSFVA